MDTDAQPEEPEEEEFGTAYVDMPVASSAGYRKRSQIRSRLPMAAEPPSLLMLEGEEKMWAPEGGKLNAGRALLLAVTLLCLVSIAGKVFGGHAELSNAAVSELSRKLKAVRAEQALGCKIGLALQFQGNTLSCMLEVIWQSFHT